MQKTNYNNKTYYLFDTLEEFIDYVNNLKITRTINRLQVHHMAAPSYDNWKTDNELRRIRNTVDYHKQVFNSSDIAQHYTIFPNGKIATGRDINSTPIGITGWNTNAICCEIYGNFDKDVMTKEQKEAVIAFYGIWCKKVNITPSSSTIRYHAWFTASGTYLGTYTQGKSTKTCPGLKFFGGNDINSFNKNFLPKVKDYISNGTVSNSTTNTITSSSVNYTVKVAADVLNVRSGAGTSYPEVGKVKKGEVYTIVEEKGNWGKLKSGLGWVCLDYVEKTNTSTTTSKTDANVKALQQALNKSYNCKLAEDGLYGTLTQAAVKKYYLKNLTKNEHAKWIQQALKTLKYNITVDGAYGPATSTVVKQFQKSQGIAQDGYAGLDTHTKIINALK